MAAAPLQELASAKDQPALRAHPDRFEPQLDIVPPVALAAAFRRSAVFRQTRARLDATFEKGDSHAASLAKSRYGIPGWDAVKALWWREWCGFERVSLLL